MTSIKAPPTPFAMYDQLVATKNYPPNGTSFGEFNITQQNLLDFLDKLRELRNNSTNAHYLDSDDTDNCNYYCNGLVQDLSVGYKSVHGYISLVVGFMGKRRLTTSDDINKIYENILVVSGVHFRHDRQHPQRYRSDAERYVQNAHKYHIKMAGGCRHVRLDRIHPIHNLYVHIPRWVYCPLRRRPFVHRWMTPQNTHNTFIPLLFSTSSSYK